MTEKHSKMVKFSSVRILCVVVAPVQKGTEIFHRHASAFFVPRIWSYYLLHYLFEPNSLEPSETSTQHARRLHCLPRLTICAFYRAGEGWV